MPRLTTALPMALALFTGCPGPPGPVDAGGSRYPLEYEGFATLRQTYHITFDDESTVECRSTGRWWGLVTEDTIRIGGEVDQLASFGGGTTQCYEVSETRLFVGTHDGERFSIEFMYESTPVTFTGSFGDEELLGAFDAEWTGVVAGFGPHEITKTEDVSVALPIVP